MTRALALCASKENAMRYIVEDEPPPCGVANILLQAWYMSDRGSCV
jgi:hypothetical protein